MLERRLAAVVDAIRGRALWQRRELRVLVQAARIRDRDDHRRIRRILLNPDPRSG